MELLSMPAGRYPKLPQRGLLINYPIELVVQRAMSCTVTLEDGIDLHVYCEGTKVWSVPVSFNRYTAHSPSNPTSLL